MSRVNIPTLTANNLAVATSKTNIHNITRVSYFREYSVHLFYFENDAEIFPVHYTCKVAEKGLKMAFIMNKLAMINFCEIIHEK
jgi:hypothetical protein